MDLHSLQNVLMIVAIVAVVVIAVLMIVLLISIVKFINDIRTTLRSIHIEGQRIANEITDFRESIKGRAGTTAALLGWLTTKRMVTRFFERRSGRRDRRHYD
jgi:hypothetical protein